jgi:4-diphosphocytidyl-2-C-methyl-D-erythritol kinase
MLDLKSYAKINLTLQILGLREDRYHEIDSIMQNVSLFDEISIEQLEGTNDIVIKCNDAKVPTDEKNLAYKAATVFLKRTESKAGLDISIKKNIPVAAGLGGGSSNAAAVLIGLNEIFRSKLNRSQLGILAADIGSDVPFFIYGGTCRARGRGELIEKMKDMEKDLFILSVPELEISSAWVYEKFDRWWIKNKKLAGMHQIQTGINLFNDLEEVVTQNFPEIGELKKRLTGLGCLQAIMSGSGPSVYGMVQDKKSGEKILAQIKNDYPRSFLVETVDRGVKF